MRANPTDIERKTEERKFESVALTTRPRCHTVVSIQQLVLLYKTHQILHAKQAGATTIAKIMHVETGSSISRAYRRRTTPHRYSPSEKAQLFRQCHLEYWPW